MIDALTSLPGVVVMPSNIIPIDTQAELYGYGVVLLRFVEVADKTEAVKEAGEQIAFLLKSKILPVYYLIFPVVTVTGRKE